MVEDVVLVSMLAPAPLDSSQPLALGARGGFDVGHMEIVRDKVDAILFELEFDSFLKGLEVACPGSARMIVGKALRSKSKKIGVTEKMSATP